MDAIRGQHLFPTQTPYDQPSKRRKVSVVVPSPSTSPSKTTLHTTKPVHKPSSLKRTYSASSSPDPLIIPQHLRTRVTPVVAPPQNRQHSSKTSITKPMKLTKSAPGVKKVPEVKKSYIPNSIPLPILARGPPVASPSYGQERIVERVYQGTSGKFCYRVEKRPRRFTIPEHLAQEQNKTADLSSARLFLGQDDSSADGAPAVEVQRHKLNGMKRATSSGGSSKLDGATTFLVPPQCILDHVSAAELESFENAFVRQQNAEEEAERRAIENERRQEMEKRMQLLVLAREERARLKMTQRAATTASAGTNTPTDGELLDEHADPDQRKKRKAGLQASDRLAATPWTIKAMKGAKYGEALVTPPASDTPKKRGRPKGWRRGHPMGYAAFKAVAEPLSTTDSSNITPAPVKRPRAQDISKQELSKADEEPEYEVKRLVAVRPAGGGEPGERQFRVEWEGYPGEDTWQDEEKLPKTMVKRFDRQHGTLGGLATPARNYKVEDVGTATENQESSPSANPGFEALQKQYPALNEDFLAAILEHERLKRQRDYDRPEPPAERSRIASASAQPRTSPAAPLNAHAKGSQATKNSAVQQNDEVEYEIQAIVDDVIEDGIRFFEVEWVGYPDENTWQTEDQLPLDAVLDYLQDEGELVRETQDDDELDDHAHVVPEQNGTQTPNGALRKGIGRVVVADDLTEDDEDEDDAEQLTSKTSILAAWGLAS